MKDRYVGDTKQTDEDAKKCHELRTKDFIQITEAREFFVKKRHIFTFSMVHYENHREIMILTHYMHFLGLFPHWRAISFDVPAVNESRDSIKSESNGVRAT